MSINDRSQMGGAGGSGRGKIQVTPRPNKTAVVAMGFSPDSRRILTPTIGDGEGFVRCGTEFPYVLRETLKAES
jgi:hypothetical protein